MTTACSSAPTSGTEGGPSPATRLVYVCLAVLLAASTGRCTACSTAPLTGYEHLNDEISEHLSKVGLGPGDVFEVRVFGEDGLSGTYRVSAGGDIDFPLVGKVKIEGRTPGEVADDVRQRLKKGFIREPFVSVYIREYNSQKIFVLGQVAKPGTFPFTGGMNVVEAITLAGGFRPSANANYVVVTRKVGKEERRIPVPVEKISEGLAANLSLQAGDIVFVPDTLL